MFDGVSLKLFYGNVYGDSLLFTFRTSKVSPGLITSTFNSEMFCFTWLQEGSLEHLIRKYYSKISMFHRKIHQKVSKKKDSVVITIIIFNSCYLFCNIILLV